VRYSCSMIDTTRRAPTDLWSVILAAGGSRRLGTSKQLLRLRSRPLISLAVEAAEAATPGRVLVVLGAQSLRLRILLRRHHPDTYTIGNTEWPSGMASSLNVGLTALPRKASAALILLVDQPGVDARLLQRLVGAWSHRPSQAAASRYDGRLGVPAILPRRLWAQAKKLTGDVGARTLLRDGERATTVVSMPEAAVDIDTEQDLAQLAAGAGSLRRRESS